jgi:hypothetical protein
MIDTLVEIAWLNGNRSRIVIIIPDVLNKVVFIANFLIVSNFEATQLSIIVPHKHNKSKTILPSEGEPVSN